MADLSAAALSQYLARLAGRRWQFGAFDCAVFMADWVIVLTGVDPIADVRGRYHNERQFLRIVRAEGGFERATAARLAAVGFTETAQPATGDILTVLAPYGMRKGKIQRRPTGAICINHMMRAVATSDIGIVIADNARLPLRTAWTLRHA